MTRFAISDQYLCRFRRSAFTLLELMIVLALMAFLVAIAWPTLRRPLNRSATQEAARQLVEELGSARLDAIETGQVMAFRYELGGSRYWIGPADAMGLDDELPEGDELESVDDELLPESVAHESGAESDSSFAGDSDSQEARVVPVLAGELDNGVIFQDPAAEEEQPFAEGSTLDSLLADEMAETEEVEPLVQQQDSVSWSAPVLVYPTGRAENATLVLKGTHGDSLTVTIRGLTGAISIGELTHDVRVAEEQAMPDESGQDQFDEPLDTWDELGE